MKRFSALFIAMLMTAVPFLTGCEEGIDTQQKKQPASFLSLVKAYEEGKVFSSAEHSSDKCIITFKDGSKIPVPQTDFSVEDCRNSEPLTVSTNGGWWKVGDVTLGVKVARGVPDAESYPVYVYFDKMTLYMHVSNGVLRKFPSVAQEEAEKKEQEAAKLQNIPVVRIKTDGGAGIYDKKNYVPGNITIEDPEKMYSEVTSFTSRMGIRGRGNSTWDWPKKPWKVKLDSKASLLGMPADKEWALLANYSDRTLVRNLTAMKLSEICEFSWTPRMRSVEVYLNDEYQGVYTLCEHKKVSSDRVDIDLVGESDNEGDAVTGGYYLEIEQQQDETTCWWTSMGVPMMFSDPEVPTDQQLEYVKNYFESYEQALWAQDWSEATGYPKYIDVDSFIDYYIVQELTKNIDGNLRKSSFITKERGKKLEMYHLWDFDLTLGNCGYFDWEVGNGPENFWIKDYTPGSWKGENWFNLMMKDPSFVTKLKNRWNELMPEFEKISQFIDDQVFSLDKAQKRNFEKWNINNSVDWVLFPSLGSYEKEVEYLKDFYTKRLQWLNRELNKL